MTADLLSVWTDSDTAMHAVGASLGIFPDQVPDARRVEDSGPPVRDALYAVLLTLVDDGALEKRACSDGRFAFPWRDGIESAAVSTGATSARLDAWLDSMPRQVPWSVPAAPVPPNPYWPRLVASVAPLLLPALSCLLALVAFVGFGTAVGVAVLGVLALAGIVGLVRRVPLAGFWTSGLIVAALLMRLS